MTAFEAAILDVDGTIVRGEQLIPGAIDGLRALEAAGMDRVLFSNNPTRGATHYETKLERHGIDIPPEAVLTSAVVSAEFLRSNHPDDPVFLVGDERLKSLLEEYELEITQNPDESGVVLGSFDREFSYGTIWESLRALKGSTPFYGTDPDATIPTDEGEIPGSGSILAAMEAVAGRKPDAILGKPSETAVEAAMGRLEAPPERTLVVGDRLDTDIALGKRAGMETAVVLTGVTRRSDIESASIEPEYVLESIGALEELLAE
ncbi:HAD family hydrolase [Halostagnicola larsenii XH-48]|uniref:HAD family hydrolase n=1 Tax=Halostagnicola larsenii XH-48 TaxID=797299 RepID=W0JLA3_9EURY|nr:HAD-IIA family hydrolase [Halostagnicola larsenii]AHF99353.1 HAD family hydrolase [Halostagnicola larsenii XH-48]